MDSFENYNLKRDLLRGIYSFGFSVPSKIQAEAIPVMIEGKEIIAQSHSGTGKTGAFTIGTLQLIDENLPVCQAIIVTPTHELANQIHEVISQLAKHMKIKISLCVGQTSIANNIKSLENCHIVVGTPGRIIDMMNQNYIDKNKVKLLILDEADQMLSGDFRKQLKNIIVAIPKKTQICLFSATITETTLKISEAFMTDPAKIIIHKEKLTLDEISQFYVMVFNDGSGKNNIEQQKYEIFKELYKIINVGQAIVYTNTQVRAKWLYDSLTADDFTCGVIYSKMEMSNRTDVLKDFRTGKFRILVSTDLLSRGIDIQKLAVVINYDVPNIEDTECYIHRIGRSGRFGKRGVAINLVAPRDIRVIRNLERVYSTTISEMPENIDCYF